MNAERVAAALARHGLSSDMSATALLVALMTRGWVVSVDGEATNASGRPRVTVQAWRMVGTEMTGASQRLTSRATGRTDVEALSMVLAKVLERGLS